jgi:hypothetical protein
MPLLMISSHHFSMYVAERAGEFPLCGNDRSQPEAGTRHGGLLSSGGGRLPGAADLDGLLW